MKRFAFIAPFAGARMTGKDYVKEGSSYAEEVKGMQERMTDRGQYKEPDEVADAAMHALFDPNPKLRYLVVPNQQEAGWTIGKQMQELVQMNADHAWSYNRQRSHQTLGYKTPRQRGITGGICFGESELLEGDFFYGFVH